MKKITVYAIIVCLFVAGYSCIYSTVQAQTIMNLAPSDQFTIPNINGTINFAIDGSYTNAILTNNSWEFANLHLDGMRNLTFGSFKVSAQNSNVTITSYISFNENDEQGQLNYSVAGKGTQTQILVLVREEHGIAIDESIDSNAMGGAFQMMKH